jgi:hypothetical protein
MLLRPKIRKIPVSEFPKNRMKYFHEVHLDLDEKGTGYLMVDLYVGWNFDGLTPPPLDLRVLESETPATLEGDMEYQFPKDCGHNPNQNPLEVFPALQDNISFRLDNRFPCQNGRASWEISVKFSSFGDDDWNFSLDVVQEYILSEGKLTVIKGGTILLESHPVPTSNHELLGAA